MVYVTFGFEGCEQEKFPIYGMNGGPIHQVALTTTHCRLFLCRDWTKFSHLRNHGFFLPRMQKEKKEEIIPRLNIAEKEYR